MLILLSEKLLQTKNIFLHSLQLTRSRSSFCLIFLLRGLFLLVYKSDCPSFSRLSVHPFVPLYACVSPMCRCLSVCLSIYQAVCRSVCLSSFLSVCLSSFCLSVKLSVFLSQSVKLSVGLSVCLSVCQVVCLSVCLSVCPVHPSVSISGYKSIPNCPSLNIRH